MRKACCYFILFIFLTFTVFLGFYAYADSRIDKIKELYVQALEMECEAGCEHFKHTLVLNTMLPAVGLQTTTMVFYYFSDQADPEKDPYLLVRELKKIKVTYNIAASVFYTIEYLYDEHGDLVFYYWQESTVNNQDEKRYYFYKGSLIKAIGKIQTEEGDPLPYEDIKNFKEDDKILASAITKKALDYKKFFETIVVAEQWK